MPGSINGLALAPRVRSLINKNLPIILASGYSEHAQAASDEGFILLRKPYGMLELRKAVKALLADAGAERNVA